MFWTNVVEKIKTQFTFSNYFSKIVLKQRGPSHCKRTHYFIAFESETLKDKCLGNNVYCGKDRNKILSFYVLQYIIYPEL